MIVGEDEMTLQSKIVYTVPKQVPLFEEQDDGNLKLFCSDN